MSHILVTGTTGFIGRSLCVELLRRGHSVRAALRREQDGERLAIAGVEHVIIGDIGAATDWHAALDGIEAVVHLAARGHVMRDETSDPLKAYRAVNSEGSLNLARQAASAGVRRFVYLSSIKVNGEGQSTPYTENDPPLPIDPYAVSKWEAEQGLMEIATKTGLEVVNLRPPLVYGPGVKANFLGMVRWLQKGIPLPFGAIHNRRSLVGLRNLVDFIASCLDHPAAANQTFLISDGEDVSTTDLLRRVATALNVSARLFPVPQKLLELGFKLVGKGDLSRRLCGSLRCDITKAKTLMGWQPPATMTEELQRTAEHFLRA